MKLNLIFLLCYIIESSSPLNADVEAIRLVYGQHEELLYNAETVEG